MMEKVHSISMTLAAMVLCLLVIGPAIVFAQLRNVPSTTVDPIVDGSRFSFPGEYTRAAVILGNEGTIYVQYKLDWNAASVQTGSRTVYPGTTLFILHDFWSATTIEIADYNFFSILYSTGANISVWVFAGEDCLSDSEWIGLSGLGYSTIDDRGFLVRKNSDPATDVQWFPGQPEPGDPGWNWDIYHGVFASAYTRDGWSGNEVYETAWYNTGNIPDEPPLRPCWTTITVGVSDPKNGEPQLQVIPIWLGELHIGVPGISVTKSGPANAFPGEIITYTITVSNPSDGDMYRVSVVDSLLGNIGGSFSASLAPRTSESRTFTYTVPSVPITNTVQVTYRNGIFQTASASASWAIGFRGGVVVPVDKFAPLYPYVGSALAIVLGTVATAFTAKRVKRRKEKQ